MRATRGAYRSVGDAAGSCAQVCCKYVHLPKAVCSASLTPHYAVLMCVEIKERGPASECQGPVPYGHVPEQYTRHAIVLAMGSFPFVALDSYPLSPSLTPSTQHDREHTTPPPPLHKPPPMNPTLRCRTPHTCAAIQVRHVRPVSTPSYRNPTPAASLRPPVQ